MDTGFYEKKICGEYKEKFSLFCDTLLEYNEKVNLTAIRDKKDVFEKHFLDSVLGESYIDKSSSVCEIGSGGGFPSLPLKIIREDLSFTLFESVKKKCEYLRYAVDKLELNCVKVCNERAENAARKPEYREKFDCAVARAVARLNVLCEYCMPFVKVGGVFVAYKGESEEEIKEAGKAISVLGGKIEKTEHFSLPSGDKRTLIIIKKISSTPSKYPRGQGKERKSPIK